MTNAAARPPFSQPYAVPEAEAASRASLALEAGRMVSWQWDIEPDIVTADDGFFAFFGLPPGPISAQDVFGQMHPEDLPRVQSEVESALSEGKDYVTEFRVRLPDGRQRWIGAQGRVTQRAPDGTALRMLGVNWDKTEQKLQDERLSIFAAEMNHRVENGFAIMAALIQIGARDAGEKREFAERLRGQVQALADAHRLTTEAERDDGAAQLSAQAVLDKALGAWTREGGPVTRAYRVDPILSARGGAALAMLAYELMTNAVKYGALGAEGGQLTVVLDDAGNGDARLRWRERLPPSGAASAEAAPSTGFGEVLLRHCATKLHGAVRREMTPTGLEVEITFPARNLASGVSPAAALEAGSATRIA